jgi:Na+/H+-translocating membrane pyrophosphatase
MATTSEMQDAMKRLRRAQRVDDAVRATWVAIIKGLAGGSVALFILLALGATLQKSARNLAITIHQIEEGRGKW